jgi:hypothetical protein
VPRNPSELARLEEEFEEAKNTFHDTRKPKGTREEAGRAMRKIAAILGYKNIGNYNGGK